MILDYNDTICALSTANGMGAIAVIRISGRDTFSIVEQLFSKKIQGANTHTSIFGVIKDGEELIDEVLVSVFKNPHSFTGEDVVEIGCHGSIYIQKRILEVLLKKGCRMAKPGEFSMRAFSNGKFDLSQAEAISDLISSSSQAAHELALKQMRGGFSNEISYLREQLINFASLIELELDFSEEDVEFADRKQLNDLLEVINEKLTKLIASFSYGNVIKNGVPISIIGAPNSGKSTLLNQLLNEEKAIVSNIAGTTRDVVEDQIVINGINFRFIDTAGIRDTDNEIEQIGIGKAIEKAKNSFLVIHLFDVTDEAKEIEAINKKIKENTNATILTVANKMDKNPKYDGLCDIKIAAIDGQNVSSLIDLLVEKVENKKASEQDVIVTNMRHYEALTKAHEAILNVQNGLANHISGDFLAIDIRQSLHFLGEITGQISTDELLGNIFGKFCIGK